jgi:FPC/CPF motif-containing protein YcgG
MTAARTVTDWKQRIIVGTRVGDDQRPAWLADSYATFRANITDKRYPCYFGAEAERKGNLFYSHITNRNVADLPATLLTFLTLCANPSRDKNNLVVFFQPAPAPLEHAKYQSLFWDTLRYLRDHDPAPSAALDWIDPSDPLWDFPFAGNLFFVVGISPSYRQRRSRNLGLGMIMVFQPRQVFRDHLTGREIGTEARSAIRERVERWDGVPPHPNLNMYGRPDNLEWTQYFISDDDTPEIGRCPLSHRAKGVGESRKNDAITLKTAEPPSRD